MGNLAIHKPQAADAISFLCRLRNSFQVVLRLRSGAGSMPCRRRMPTIVVRPTAYPRLESAPWIRS